MIVETIFCGHIDLLMLFCIVIAVLFYIVSWLIIIVAVTFLFWGYPDSFRFFPSSLQPKNRWTCSPAKSEVYIMYLNVPYLRQ
jgi:hypothetical protein